MDKKIRLSFVRLHKHWHVFDPYNGVYFVNTSGDLANINAIKKGNFQSEYLGAPKEAVLNYGNYIDNIPDIEEVSLGRSKIQSPFKRLKYELQKLVKPNKK